MDNVLYAIRNGGYSGAIMPQNIVVGEDAQAVAEFVAEYAGRRRRPPASSRATTTRDITGGGDTDENAGAPTTDAP